MKELEEYLSLTFNINDLRQIHPIERVKVFLRFEFIYNQTHK